MFRRQSKRFLPLTAFSVVLGMCVAAGPVTTAGMTRASTSPAGAFPARALPAGARLLGAVRTGESAYASPQARARAARALVLARRYLASSVHLEAGRHAILGQASRSGLQASAPSGPTSPNWAGYVADNESYTMVQGWWYEPKTTCGSVTTSAAFWVGLGGVGDTALEQAGTMAGCYQGTESDFMWWVIYPNSSDPTAAASMQVEAVKPGDLIGAEVENEGNNNFIFYVHDYNDPSISLDTQKACAYPCTWGDNTAEWIVEAPTVQQVVPAVPADSPPGGGASVPVPQSQGSIADLADYGQWNLFDGYASTSYSLPISSFPNFAFTEVDSAGNVMSSPGNLSGNGDSFTDIWLNGS